MREKLSLINTVGTLLGRPLLSIMLFSSLLSIFPSTSFSLGLGEITVLSGLNQKFDAQIELYAQNSKDLLSLEVGLASIEDFTRAGIDRYFFLSQLNFELVQQKDAGAHTENSYIKISSDVAVKEPFLNLIVVLNSGSGKLLREYTVLLDPPVYDGSKIGEINMVQSLPDEPQTAIPTQRSVSREAMQPQKEQPQKEIDFTEPLAAESPVQAPYPLPNLPSKPPNDDGSYSDVTRWTDTMWGLAIRIRPDPSLSIQQTMMALLAKNPGAFTLNNVNGLKQGYFLSIPTVEEILSIDKNEAMVLLTEHNQHWTHRTLARIPQFVRGAAQAKVGTSATEAEDRQTQILDAAPRPTFAEELEQPGVLSLGSTGLKEAVQAQEQNTQANLALEDIQQQVGISLEAIETITHENEGLRTRISGLEEQLNALTGLIKIRNEELAQLQESLLQGQTSAQALGTVRTTPIQADKDNWVEQALGFTRQVNSVYLMMALSILLLLMGVRVVVKILKKQRERRQHQLDSNKEVKAQYKQQPAPVPNVHQVIEIIPQQAAESTLDDSPSSPEAIPEAKSVEAVSEDLPKNDKQLSDIDDLLGVVDLDIAYGRYQEAEKAIQSVLEQQPDSVILLEKMLEVYSDSDNQEAFTQTLTQLKPLVDEARMQSYFNTHEQVWQTPVKLPETEAPTHNLKFTLEDPDEPSLDDKTPQAESSDDENILEFNVPDYNAEQADAEQLKRLDKESRLMEAQIKEEGHSLDFEIPTQSNTEPSASITENDMSEMTSDDINITDEVGTTDDISTKIQLAQAYIDMGDSDSAKELLAEVEASGDEISIEKARLLLAELE